MRNIAAIEQDLAGFVKSLNPQDSLEKFEEIAGEITSLNCSASERKKLLARFVNVALIYFQIKINQKDAPIWLEGFFKNLADISKFSDAGSKPFLDDEVLPRLISMAQRVEIKNLSRDSLNNFVKNLDWIGLGASAEVFSQGNLEEALRSFDRDKNFYTPRQLVHFLLHAKNIGALKNGVLSADNKGLLEEALRQISSHIVDCEDSGFSPEDFDAANEIFLYSENVLKIPNNPEAQKIIAENLPKKEPHISKFQHQIFQAIIAGLENRKAGDNEWQHVLGPKSLSYNFQGFVVKMEGGVIFDEELHRALKTSDIVVYAPKGAVFFAIEVDGSPHYLTATKISGKTAARNELLSSRFGENFIRVSEFGDLSKADFIEKIQAAIQKKIAKDHKKSKKALATERKEEAPKTQEKQASPALQEKPQDEKKPRQFEKSKAQILQENKDLFEKLLQEKPFSQKALREIKLILPNNISSLLKDFSASLDAVLERLYNCKVESEKELLVDLFYELWYGGFEFNRELLKDKDPKKYPAELSQILFLQEKKPTSFAGNLALFKLNLSKERFDFLLTLTKERGLPQELSEDWEKVILALTVKLLFSKAEIHKNLLESFDAYPWFSDLKSRIFIMALNSSQEELVKVFLARESEEFFCEIFKRDENLLEKIFDFESYATIDSLVAKLVSNADLADKINHQRVIHESKKFRNKGDAKDFIESLSKMVDGRPNFCNLGVTYLCGIGVDCDRDRARDFFLLAIGHQRSYIAMANLASMARDDNDIEDAIKYYEMAIEEYRVQENGQLEVSSCNSLATIYENLAGKIFQEDDRLMLSLTQRDLMESYRNYQKAHEYHELAANAGCTDSMLRLGILHLRRKCGAFVDRESMKGEVPYEKMKEIGLGLVRQAADLGDLAAIVNMTDFFISGHFVEQDLNQASAYLRRADEIAQQTNIEHSIPNFSDISRGFWQEIENERRKLSPPQSAAALREKAAVGLVVKSQSGAKK